MAQGGKGDIMPTVEFSLADLQKLLGKKITLEQLKKEGILYAKGEIESEDSGVIKADIKDTNRPDLWSVEGIARELRGHYGIEQGLPKFSVRKPSFIVNVDKKVENVRPKIAAAVVKCLKFDDNAIVQMIQLQEKVCQTYGANRRDVAIGVYDYDKIKPPVKYTVVGPKGVKFVPLEFSEEMTPEEIIKKHPKGVEYRHLVKDGYPLLIDAAEHVLSMPPVINSDYTGKVTKKTMNVFVEVTGFSMERISTALNVIVSALAERGGRMESVEVRYPKEKVIAPDFSPKSFSLNTEYCRKILGIELSPREIAGLLEQARYDVKIKGSAMYVNFPAYRNDIMHSRDIIEDIAISFGYNKIKPEMPLLATTGSSDAMEDFSDSVRNIAIGMGMQEIATFVLTNKENAFSKMNMPEKKIAEIENPVSENWTCMRPWLLPGLLEFLAKNKHNEYPQKIFEIGDAVILDSAHETNTRDRRMLAAIISDNEVNYEQMSSCLDALMSSLGIKYALKTAEHASFIRGRCAAVIATGIHIGIVGEMHPQVLQNWKLDMPVLAMELYIDDIMGILEL